MKKIYLTLCLLMMSGTSYPAAPEANDNSLAAYADTHPHLYAALYVHAQLACSLGLGYGYAKLFLPDIANTMYQDSTAGIDSFLSDITSSKSSIGHIGGMFTSMIFSSYALHKSTFGKQFVALDDNAKSIGALSGIASLLLSWAFIRYQQIAH